MKTSIRTGLAIVTLTALAVVLFPTPAFAATKTEIAFTSASPVDVQFGQDWSLVLRVQSKEGDYRVPLGEADGTVDVYVSGIGGIFAEELPIQVGGFVYVSQPDGQPLLSAGEHEFSAIFTPGNGLFLDSSQTKTNAVVSVSALTVVPSVSVETNSVGAEDIAITASIAGTYAENTGGAPAGTWSFSLWPAGGEQPTTWSQDVAQSAGVSDPLIVPITAPLDAGITYTLSSSFVPVASIAGGLDVTTIEDNSFQAPGGGFGSAFGATLAMPLWLLIGLILIISGLTVTAIVLGSRLNSRVPLAEGGREFDDDVELMSLDEAGLLTLDTHPIPSGSAWLLSDLDSAVGAPTVRIDAPLSADAPTEFINTSSAETPLTDAETPPTGTEPTTDTVARSLDDE
jgi:hypothetical protein